MNKNINLLFLFDINIKIKIKGMKIVFSYGVSSKPYINNN